MADPLCFHSQSGELDVRTSCVAGDCPTCRQPVLSLLRTRTENKQLWAQALAVGKELADQRATNERLGSENEELHAQLVAVGKERDDARNINAQLHAQFVAVGKERDDVRNINAQLHAQFVAVGKERDDLLNMNAILHTLFVAEGKERGDLRRLSHRAGVAEIWARGWHYTVRRLTWRERSLCRELWGKPAPCPSPPKEIPAELVERFTMGGKVTLVHSWGDCTYPANYLLIYGDEEIDAYIAEIARTLALPAEQRDWTIYGTPDRWTCEAIAKYPIAGKRVLNMGSLSTKCYRKHLDPTVTV